MKLCIYSNRKNLVDLWEKCGMYGKILKILMKKYKNREDWIDGLIAPTKNNVLIICSDFRNSDVGVLGI